MMIEPRLNGQMRSLGQGRTRVKNSSMATPMQISGTTMRQGEGALDGRLADEAVAPQQHRGERTDDERDDRGQSGRWSASWRRRSAGLVVEQLLVVVEREAAPDDVALAVVEAEGDQRDQRRVEEEERRRTARGASASVRLYSRGARRTAMV